MAKTPTSPELEEKKKLVEQLKAEKAAREKVISDTEAQLKAQKQELEETLRYFDQLAKEQQERLKALKKAGTPEAEAEIKAIEAKLGVYQTVRAAAQRFEETAGAMKPSAFAATGVTLRIAEAEACIANARLVLNNLASAMEILRATLGQTHRLHPQQGQYVAQLKPRLKMNPALTQQLTATLHYYQETKMAVATEEQNLATLRGLAGKEALKFASGMKISALQGKLNNLWGLKQTYAKEPLVSALFPDPAEIPVPKQGPATPGKKNKPLTGVLLEMLGLKPD